jgi:SOS-response transcriptional repressor LexA
MNAKRWIPVAAVLIVTIAGIAAIQVLSHIDHDNLKKYVTMSNEQINTLSSIITERDSTIAERDNTISTLKEQCKPAASKIKITDITTIDGMVFFPATNCCVTTVQDTGSMLPMIDKGVTIILQATNDVQIGDVAVYDTGTQQIIHRIVGEDGDNWIFKGDNNDYTETTPKVSVIFRLIAVLY